MWVDPENRVVGENVPRSCPQGNLQLWCPGPPSLLQDRLFRNKFDLATDTLTVQCLSEYIESQRRKL